jgi:3-oxoacyl-[acyl-carrier-protein] synthase I
MNHPGNSRACLMTAGLVSSAGLDRGSACAAARAQLSSFQQSRFISHAGDPIIGGYIDALGSEVGTSRLIQLAAGALAPVLEALEPYADIETVPLYLGLPERRTVNSPGDGVVAGLAAEAGLNTGSRWRAIHEGHGSALLALERAIDEISRDETELCIVGGVDSYWQEETLDWMAEQRRLISETSRDGLVPGEGAAFILVASQTAARRMDLQPEALIASIATDREPYPRNDGGICIGQGLTSVMRRALTHPTGNGARADWVLCDMNGESLRGTEWMYAYIRTGKMHRDPLEIWHPADCWGDVGAASGAMLLAQAMHALSEGYGRGSRVLVWTASDGPWRGAAVLHDARSQGWH